MFTAIIPVWRRNSAIFSERSFPEVFLFLIATINLFVFLNVYKLFKEIRRRGSIDEQAMDEQMEKRGLYARILRPLLKIVKHSWQMYPIGFLFGLGFDTATEVGAFRYFRNPGIRRHAGLVHHDVSGTVYRGHVPC